MIRTEDLAKKFFEVSKELQQLFAKKNFDYGNDQIKAFGDFGILVRSYDKIQRLKNIYQKKELSVPEETIDDTWRDLAVYAIMAVMYRNGEWEK